ncbi:hypothetical protein AB0F17_37235 [Nonomuraea sp. NPDC026600]|uniref:hypothetical protein n=1 Tax=Nonomuraea sp. NPDC026600 TaxID=3155363 RepID=UPI0033EA1A38
MPPNTAPPGDLPHPRGLDDFEATARGYDAGLGGKDHYQADKAGFKALMEVAPGLRVAL